LVIHQASADVVLGFVGRTGRHPPNDDSDSIAGVAGWALSFHGTKLLRVTDKNGLCVLFDEADELIKENRSDGGVDQDEAHEREVKWEGIPKLGFVPEIVGDPIGLNKDGDEEAERQKPNSNFV
jgi:hypothetical protein